MSPISVLDCLFRMMRTEEIKLGMAFAPAFTLFGSDRDRARLCGNAVTPCVPRDLIAAITEILGGGFDATDLFCGAGGSSSGMELVDGVTVRMASNHWKLAIETHNFNMPHVDHDIADISKVDPRRYPRTDFLWASPECKFWSQGRGEKEDFTDAAAQCAFDLGVGDDTDDEPESAEAKERSRALMQDVPRFAEHHRYKAIIVENVPRILKWRYLPKWVARMRALGYEHQILTLNSAFAHQLGAPAPQLRDRFYAVFWQANLPRPDFDRWTRPLAYCPSCDAVVTALRSPKNPNRPYGVYWSQYVFRCPQSTCRVSVVHPFTLPALAALDLSDPGTRIGDRTKPLAPKTIARIEAWLSRYAGPAVVEAAGNTYDGASTGSDYFRVWPVADPLRTLHTTLSKGIACPPALVPVEGRAGKNPRHTLAPAATQTGRNETAVLVPAGGTWNDDARSVWEPMRVRTTRETEGVALIPLRGTNRPKAVMEPLDTFAAEGFHHGVAAIMRNNSGGAEMLTPLDEPIRTLTTAGHQSLVWNPNVLFAYDTGAFRSTRDPLPTQTTIQGDALVEVVG